MSRRWKCTRSALLRDDCRSHEPSVSTNGPNRRTESWVTFAECDQTKCHSVCGTQKNTRQHVTRETMLPNDSMNDLPIVRNIAHRYDRPSVPGTGWAMSAFVGTRAVLVALILVPSQPLQLLAQSSSLYHQDLPIRSGPGAGPIGQHELDVSRTAVSLGDRQARPCDDSRRPQIPNVCRRRTRASQDFVD